MTTKTWVLAYDIHTPHHHMPSIRALLAFLHGNDVDGFLFGGDQLSLDEISHHTKGKNIHRPRGSMKKNLDRFDREVLTPIEKALKPGAKKVWLTGNHERFLQDLLDEQIELEGMLSIENYLRLRERGWKVVPLSGHYRIGKLWAIHGDQIGHSVMVARKAVETWSASLVMGHVHQYSAFTKSSPVHRKDRWTAVTLPCLCDRAPSYGRGRANSWTNGFGIVEVRSNGHFNLWPVIVSEGEFSFGGRVYSGDKRRKAMTEIHGVELDPVEDYPEPHEIRNRKKPGPRKRPAPKPVKKSGKRVSTTKR